MAEDKNAWWKDLIAPVIAAGTTIYSSSQQRALKEEELKQANLALEIEKTKIAQIQAQKQLVDAQKAQAIESSKAKGKSYVVPLLITGGVVIIGIATYFIFKKKKIN